MMVVPKDDVAETACKAKARAQEEEGKRSRLASGESGMDMYKMRETPEKASLIYVGGPPEDWR